MKQKGMLIVTFCSLFIFNLSNALSSTEFNGNIWIDMNNSDKLSYIIGFVHASNKEYSEMENATKYHILDNTPDCTRFFKDIELDNILISINSKLAKECVNLAVSFRVWSYYKYTITGISPKQIIDGIDIFYKDFKNRSILIEDAIHFVKRQIKGMEDTKDFKATLLWLRSGKNNLKREYNNSKGEKRYVVFP